MKQIKLTQGYVALVDDDEFERLNRHKWRYSTGYAVRWGPRTNYARKMIYMHRVVVNAPDSHRVDHKNMDRLDNQRHNLRIATELQNHINTTKRSHNTTGYKGVSKHNNAPTWYARIAANGVVMYLGSYRNPEDAARAYDAKARELFGEFSRTNF